MQQAWIDSDDENEEVVVKNRPSLALNRKEVAIGVREYAARVQHRVSRAGLEASSWYSRMLLEEVEDDEDVLRSAAPIRGRSLQLPSKELQTKRLPDVDAGKSVNVVRFHPNGKLLVAFSADDRVRIFGVNPVKPRLLSEIRVPRRSFLSAECVKEGTHMAAVDGVKGLGLISLETNTFDHVHLVSPGHKFQAFHHLSTVSAVCPLVALSGANAEVVIADLRTNRVANQFKTSLPPECAVFHPNGQRVYSGSKDGKVLEWDLVAGKCSGSLRAPGGLTTMTTSRGRQLRLAVGSSSGFLDLYDIGSPSEFEYLEPLKSFKNLLFPVTDVRFHPYDELLHYSSRETRDTAKAVHVPSKTVYQNYPPNKGLGRVTTADFSVGSLMAVANSVGRVTVYDLLHYQLES